MLRPHQIAPLFLAAALTLTLGCQRTQMQRCVDEHSTVVDNDLCQSSGEGRVFGSRLPPASYHWYYGGTGSAEPGTTAANGSSTAEPDRQYSLANSPTSRTGLSRTFVAVVLAIAGLIILWTLGSTLMKAGRLK